MLMTRADRPKLLPCDVIRTRINQVLNPQIEIEEDIGVSKHYRSGKSKSESTTQLSTNTENVVLMNGLRRLSFIQCTNGVLEGLKDVIPLKTPANAQLPHFLALNDQSVSVWHGADRLKVLSTQPPRLSILESLRVSVNGSSNNRNESPLCYVTSIHRIPEMGDGYAAVTSKQKLRLLDCFFHSLYEISLERPVLTMQVVPISVSESKKTELIVATCGQISIYRIEKRRRNGQVILDDEPRGNESFTYIINGPVCVMNGVDSNAWIRALGHDHTTNTLYAALEDKILQFNMSDGALIRSFSYGDEKVNTPICKMTIAYSDTKMGLKSRYIVFGSLDGVILVTDMMGRLIRKAAVHRDRITSLMILRNSSSMQSYRDEEEDLGVLISGSLDGALRVWDMVSGQCIENVQTESQLLGLFRLTSTSDNFAHFSPEGVTIWVYETNFERFARLHSQLTFLGSNHFRCQRRPDDLTMVKIVPEFMNSSIDKCDKMCNRLVVVAEDGSIRIMSSVTGYTLLIAFPIYKDTSVRQVFYDPCRELLYTWLQNDEIIVYDASSNPCVAINLLCAWNHRVSVAKESIHQPMLNHVTCAASGYTRSPKSFKLRFTMFCGTEEGEIHSFDPTEHENQGRFIEFRQPVLHIHFSTSKQRLLAISREKTLKMFDVEWKVKALDDGSLKWLEGKGSRHESIHLRPAGTWTVQYPKGGYMSHMFCTEKTAVIVVQQNEESSHKLGKSRLLFVDLNNSNKDPRVVEHPSPLIPCISALESLNIFTTSSGTGNIYVWNGYDGSLIREIQFNTNFEAVGFLNDRGDLAFGFNNDIYFLPVQKYLNKSLMKDWQNLMFKDCEIELPREFEGVARIWKIFSCLAHTQDEGYLFEENVSEELEKMKKEMQAMLVFNIDEEEFSERERRLAFQHAEREFYRQSRKFEPALIHMHMANSGVEWKLVKKFSKLFYPDLKKTDLFGKSLFLQIVSIFNRTRRFEQLLDTLSAIQQEIELDFKISKNVLDLMRWADDIDKLVLNDEDDFDDFDEGDDDFTELLQLVKPTEEVVEKAEVSFQDKNAAWLKEKADQINQMRKAKIAVPNSASFARESMVKPSINRAAPVMSRRKSSLMRDKINKFFGPKTVPDVLAEEPPLTVPTPEPVVKKPPPPIEKKKKIKKEPKKPKALKNVDETDEEHKDEEQPEVEIKITRNRRTRQSILDEGSDEKYIIRRPTLAVAVEPRAIFQVNPWNAQFIPWTAKELATTSIRFSIEKDPVEKDHVRVRSFVNLNDLVNGDFASLVENGSNSETSTATSTRRSSLSHSRPSSHREVCPEILVIYNTSWFPVSSRKHLPKPADVLPVLLNLQKDESNTIEHRIEASKAILYMYQTLPDAFKNQELVNLIIKFQCGMLQSADPVMKAQILSNFMGYNMPEDKSILKALLSHLNDRNELVRYVILSGL